MKKSLLILFTLFAVSITANAQKFALIDMEYILKNIPAYERANEQLEQASRQWQSEVEKISEEAKTLYKNYQSQIASLSETQRGKKEEEIVAKEKSVTICFTISMLLFVVFNIIIINVFISNL